MSIDEYRGRQPWKNPLKKVLMELQSSSNEAFTYPFLEPVDAQKLNLTDYHRIIKKPMDLSTISANLEQNRYTDKNDCLLDLYQILYNCRLYNPVETGKGILDLCQRLEDTIVTLLKLHVNPAMIWPPHGAPELPEDIVMALKHQKKPFPSVRAPDTSFTASDSRNILPRTTHDVGPIRQAPTTTVPTGRGQITGSPISTAPRLKLSSTADMLKQAVSAHEPPTNTIKSSPAEVTEILDSDNETDEVMNGAPTNPANGAPETQQLPQHEFQSNTPVFPKTEPGSRTGAIATMSKTDSNLRASTIHVHPTTDLPKTFANTQHNPQSEHAATTATMNDSHSKTAGAQSPALDTKHSLVSSMGSRHAPPPSTAPSAGEDTPQADQENRGMYADVS